MKSKLLLILFVSLLPLGAIAQVLTKIDEVGTFQENLGAVKKDGAWGFINTDGVLVIDYNIEILSPPNGAPTFSSGMCMTKEVRDGITFYGYINTKGDKVIPADYLVATPFENGFARVIKYYKTESENTNVLGKRIAYHSYNELVIDTNNETVQHLIGPKNLNLENLKSKDFFLGLSSFFVGEDLIAVYQPDDTFSIYKLKK